MRGPRRGYQPDHMWDLPDGQHERNPCAPNKFLSGCIFASAQSPKPDPRSSPLVPQNACTPAKSPERPAMRCEAEWSQRFSRTCKQRRQPNASDQKWKTYLSPSPVCLYWFVICSVPVTPLLHRFVLGRENMKITNNLYMRLNKQCPADELQRGRGHEKLQFEQTHMVSL